MATIAEKAGEVCDDIKDAVQGKPDTELDKDHQAIVQGLIKKRLHWHHDSMLKNYWFHLCQVHVILGILGCHKFHPYNRSERVFVWMTIVISAFGLALIASHPSYSQGSIQGLSLLISVYLAIKAMLLKGLVTCAAVQDGSGLQVVARVFHADGAVKRNFEKAGRCVACVSLVISLIWLIAGIIARAASDAAVPWATVFEEFFLSQIYGWLIEIGWRSVIFLFHWFVKKEGTGGDDVRNKMEDKYPEGSEYPKDKNLLWQGDRSQCKGCLSEATGTVDAEEVAQPEEDDLPPSAKV